MTILKNFLVRKVFSIVCLIFTTGIVDSSGVRFFYTDQPPKHKAAFLGVGHQVVGHMIIPPHVERYTVNGYCSQRCTNAVST